MRYRRGSNHRNQGDPFNVDFNQGRRNWRRRDNNPHFPPALAHMPPQPYGMNTAGMSPGVSMDMGNYYYPGSVSPMPQTAPLSYPIPLPPSPVFPAAAVSANMSGTQNVVGTGPSASAATVPEYPKRYYTHQPQPPRAMSASPESPKGVPSVAHWAEDVAKHHFVDETSVNETAGTARVDQSADGKRLFLEEYRYAGPQAQYEPPTCPKSTESDLGKGKRASSGDSDNGTGPEKEKETEGDNTGDSSKSKLRGDAPVFIPHKRRQLNWMVVSST